MVKAGERDIIWDAGALYVWYVEREGSDPSTRGVAKADWQRREVGARLQAEGYTEPVIRKPSGQPLLPNRALSISHAGGWFAVLVAQHAAGVDIQPHRRSLEASLDFFLSEAERALLSNERDAYLAWSAKEAFFKYVAGALDSYRNDMTITQVDRERSALWLSHAGQDHALRWLQNDLYTLAYIAR